MQRRLRLRVLFFTWFVSALGAAPAFAPPNPPADPPTFTTIYDFGWSNRFDRPRVIELESVADPVWVVPIGEAPRRQERFAIRDSATLIEFGVNPTSARVESRNVQLEVQRATLLNYLRDGYITPEFYAAVAEATDLWRASQLRYAVSWSELTVGEARKRFGGSIPWERVMDTDQKQVRTRPREESAEWKPSQIWERDWLWPDSKRIRIVRASAMVGVGQVYDPETRRIEHLPLAWMKSKEHRADVPSHRRHLPLVAEVTRAQAYGGTLPGTLRVPLQALFGHLATEARLAGLPPERYLIFGRFLKAPQTCYFARAFKMNPWRGTVRDLFERHPERAFDAFPHVKLPRGIPDDNLLIATLATLGSVAPFVDISARDEALRRLTEGRLELEAARRLQEAFVGLRWRYLQFEGFPESPDPVILWDNSPLPFAFLADVMESAGVRDDRVANALMNHLNRLPDWEPNLFSAFWREVGFIAPVADVLRSGHESTENPGIRIDNLSDAAARAHPGFYTYSVVTGTYAFLRSQLETASATVRFNVRHIYEQVETQLGERYRLGPGWDPDRILAGIPFGIGTSSAAIAKELRSFGALERPAFAIETPKLSGEVTATRADVRASVRPDAAVYWFELTGAQIAALARREGAFLHCAEAAFESLLLHRASHY